MRLITLISLLVIAQAFAAKPGEEVEPGKLFMTCVSESVVGPLAECSNSGIKCFKDEYPLLFAQNNSNECKDNFREKIGCYCISKNYVPPKPQKEYKLSFCTIDDDFHKMECKAYGCGSLNKGKVVSNDPACKDKPLNKAGCYCPKN